MIALSLVFITLNSKGECGVKSNGVLAVSMFSLEANRIKGDCERQPRSSNCQLNLQAFLCAGESSLLTSFRNYVTIGYISIKHVTNDSDLF